MDIAAEHHHTRFVEDHRFTRRTLIEAQLEALGQRKGIDVMANIVAIGERHRGAGTHRQHIRGELL